MIRKNLVHLLVALAAMSSCTLGSAGAEDFDIAAATLAEPNQTTREVSTRDVRRSLADGSAIVVDTRTPAEFSAGHIPGARMLASASADPVETVARLAGGDRSTALILYCNGPFCQASRRLGDRLSAAGFTNVRRYQLGMPVWRALGGPTEIDVAGFLRVHGLDRTAVFVDARSPEDFARGSLPGARSLPVEAFIAGEIRQPPLPEDDFNTRVVLFGRDARQARELAEALGKRPWHNVSYVGETFEALRAAVR